MVTKLAGAFALAMTLALAPVQAKDISRQIPVDKGFVESSITFSGQPDIYKMLVKLINVGGRMEFCGIGAFKSVQYRSGVMRGMRTTKLRVNGKVVIKGLDYFALAKNPQSMRAGKANCRATGLKTPRNIEDIAFDWGKFY